MLKSTAQKLLVVMTCWFLFFFISIAHSESYTVEDYDRVEKVDIHVHLKTDDTQFVRFAWKDRFRFLNIAVHANDEAEMRLRHRTAFIQAEANPSKVAVASSFPMNGWDKSEWNDRTLGYLDETFKKGAVAVKVWKNIGMEFRDENGDLVMIDDPGFDPVFKHLSSQGIRLIGHLGEPKNCWLPLEQMTVKNDQSYFRRHAQYHMFKHPEMPSYQDQMAARDRMLEKNPDLHFIGAHFGSLEWSLYELGKFLDRFPNAVVDTAARMGQLQYQSQENLAIVRGFINRYKERILYGTDLTCDSQTDPKAFYARAHEKWLRDWRYFSTGNLIKVPELDEPVRGLSLPRETVDHIYRLNAQRLFSNSWK